MLISSVFPINSRRQARPVSKTSFFGGAFLHASSSIIPVPPRKRQHYTVVAFVPPSTPDTPVNMVSKGVKVALLQDEHLRNGLNVHRGMITCEAVARDLGYDYVSPLEALGRI